jgi:hypothetical protein
MQLYNFQDFVLLVKLSNQHQSLTNWKTAQEYLAFRKGNKLTLSISLPL